MPIGDSTGLTIPVVVADFATGEALYTRDAAARARVTVHVVAEFLLETRTAENVIAETRAR